MSRPSPKPYSVEFSPKAWKQVGALPLPAFNQMKQAINSVAEAVGNTRRTPPVGLLKHAGVPRHSLSVTVGELIVLYQVDDALRRVMVLELAESSPEAQPERIPPSSGR